MHRSSYAWRLYKKADVNENVYADANYCAEMAQRYFEPEDYSDADLFTIDESKITYKKQVKPGKSSDCWSLVTETTRFTRLQGWI